MEYEYRLMTAEEESQVGDAELAGYCRCLRRPPGGDTWFVTHLTPEEYVKVFPDQKT